MVPPSVPSPSREQEVHADLRAERGGRAGCATMEPTWTSRTSLTRSWRSTSGATNRCGTATCTAASRAPRPQFSFYFPPAEQYEGRFLHHVEGGGGGTPRAQPGDIALACAYGGYLVVSNQGHIGPRRDTPRSRDPPPRRERRHGAPFARRSPRTMYGEPPHHGYIWGGSGGAGRTIAILEHAPDLYQGAVVYILPHVAQQVLCAAVANAARVLGDALAARRSTPPRRAGAATRSPASTAHSATALADVYRVGFPRGAEDQIYPVSIALNGVVPGLVDFDPGYFDDFWTEPGYGGTTESLRDARIQSTHAVRRGADRGRGRREPGRRRHGPVPVPRGRRHRPHATRDADRRRRSTACPPATPSVRGSPSRSGAAAGRELISLGGGGDVIVAAGGRRNMSVGFEDVGTGDEIAFDNSHYLAYTHFTRHQHEDYPEFATFVVDGRTDLPAATERDRLTRPLSRRALPRRVRRQVHRRAEPPRRAVLAVWRGEPPAAARRAARIGDATCACGSPSTRCTSRRRRCARDRAPIASTRLIDYGGHVQQAIRDVIDWVEHGTRASRPTPPSTSTDDGAIVLRDDAAERRGIQPVVRADGERRGASRRARR